MKTILLSVFIFYFNAVCTAQSTWIQRLSWNVYVGTIHNDSVCGIYDAAPSLDGNIFLITKDDLDNHARLLKMDMNNHQEIWSANAGFWSSMNVFRTSFVKPTPDSGCIIAFNHYVYADYEESEVRKYSGGGTIIQIK
ncbi:MAG TPA: hypothetical protein VJY62_15030 [Bacteroidia bacterium]|nr:hypothetical protein [Bacteroidia bacterium]